MGIGFRHALCAVVAALLAAPVDLDCDLPTGTPFDSIKTPRETPTGGRPGDTASSTPKPKPDPGKAGGTVAEEPGKKPPPKPPTGLPGVKAPSTIDYQNHLGWKPKDEIVDWKDPLRPPTATGSTPEPEKNLPEKWDVSGYPPKVPNDLYEYCITRYLMVMLHPAQVSERELTQFLIELDYPAFYAATACRGEARVKRMAETVIACVGPMVKQPPAKPAGEVAQKVYMDLLQKYPYEDGFAKWILSQPSEQTLPVLLDIVKNHKHPLLVRNAIFVLRCFNTPELVGPVRDLLTRTKDPVTRNRALVVLVRWQDGETVDWLKQQIVGSDLTFRNMAVWALGRIGAPGAIEAVIDAAKKGDAEFLWTAIFSLGWLAQSAPEDKRKKIEDALTLLQKAVASVKDPPAWDGTGIMATRTPEPSNILSKILVERCRIALACCGRDAERAWMKKLGTQSGAKGNEGSVHISNVDFFNEVLEKLPK
jgi:hypothetical protein